MTAVDDTRRASTRTAITTGAPTVIKRDGTPVNYDVRRVRSAVARAWQRITGSVNESALAEVVAAVDAEVAARFERSVKVYEIQAVVEHILIENGHAEIAAGYTDYRLARDLRRAQATDVEHQVARLIAKDSTVVNENANKDSRVYHTQRDLMAGSVAKAKGLAMLPPRVASAHNKGQIHYHDLDYSPMSTMHNCELSDFEGMLRDGFAIGETNIDTPKSILTAATVLTQIMLAISSSKYGGLTVETIDVLLAPYAEKSYAKHLAEAETWVAADKREDYARAKTSKDIYDAMQTIEYQIGSMHSSNGQVPFTSVGFGLGTSWFEREIQKAILQVRIGGLGPDRKTAIFPKLIFTIRDGVNAKPGDPNYDIKQLAIECSTKRMYPDYLSYENTITVTGSYKSPMGCRSFLTRHEDGTENGETTGRMNLGVVTLNLPRIALETAGDIDAFWRLLDERLDIVREAIDFRIRRCFEGTPESAPILFQHGAFGKRLQPGDDVSALMRNGRATVSAGYIGLYEVATVFFGPNWETNPQAKEFTLAVIKHMKAATTRWTEQSDDKVARGVYGTPSESLTDRFARMDYEKFGPVRDITDKGYYTNSFHYDVRKSPTPFEKIAFERDYPLAGSSGGFIHYVEFPVLRHNPKALEAVIDYAMGPDGVAYFGVNTPIDRCFLCEFEGDFESTDAGFVCPGCGQIATEATANVTKRVCGYLGSPAARPWAKGRALEHRARLKHDMHPVEGVAG